MGGSYDYLNARVRGMTGRLLPEDRLQESLSVPDQPSWIALLRGTPYEPFLGGANPASLKALLFEAVDRGMAARTRQLSRCSVAQAPPRLSALEGGDGPELAAAILLGEWDLGNLLAVLAGVARHAPPAETLSATLAGGMLGPEQLAELARAHDPREVADRIATWGYPFAAAVREGLGRPGESPGPTTARLDLVRAFYRLLSAASGRSPDPALGRYLATRIDHLNLSTALLWQSLPVDRSPDDFFLAGGGRFSIAAYRRALAAPSVDAALGEAPASFRGPLGEAMVAHEADRRLSVFWQALDRDIFRQFTRSTGVDPLNASLLLCFLLKLRREGTVLKLGLVRLALNVPPEVFAQVAGNV